MKFPLLAAIFFTLSIISCKPEPRPFAEQLKSNFLNHLNNTDSSLVLDSFHVFRVDTANQRLFSVVEDTLYKISLGHVQLQMNNATRDHKSDSMLFYQGELNYMFTRSDSLTKAIAKADTVKKYGLLASCFAQVSKGGRQAADRVYYFLDLNMTILNPDRIDSSAAQLSARLK